MVSHVMTPGISGREDEGNALARAAIAYQIQV
jgi:hypothetical protein